MNLISSTSVLVTMAQPALMMGNTACLLTSRDLMILLGHAKLCIGVCHTCGYANLGSMNLRA